MTEPAHAKTVLILREEAKKKKIKGYSKMNRAELCAALKYKNCGKRASLQHMYNGKKASVKNEKNVKKASLKKSPLNSALKTSMEMKPKKNNVGKIEMDFNTVNPDCPYEPKYKNLEDFLAFMKTHYHRVYGVDKYGYKNPNFDTEKRIYERGTLVPLSMTYLCPRDMALLDTLIVNGENDKYEVDLEDIFKHIANMSTKEPERVDALVAAFRMMPLERQQYYVRWFAFKPLGTYFFGHPAHSKKTFLEWVRETEAGQDAFDAIIQKNIHAVQDVLIYLPSANMEFYKNAFQRGLNIKRIPDYTEEMMVLYKRYYRKK